MSADTGNHQLELKLAIAVARDPAGTGGGERCCPICGAALDGRRRDALYCGGPCRAEASRVRRLWAGQKVDGYRDPAEYSARHKRTERGRGELASPYLEAPDG